MTSTAPILKPLSNLLAAEERAALPAARMEDGESNMDQTPIVYRVCSWCQAGMGVQRAVIRMAGSISHGVCPPCKAKFLAGLETSHRPSCQRSTGQAEPIRR